MATPNNLAAEPAHTPELLLSLEGMPTLPRDRTREDFPPDERFVYLFDPKWRDEEPELVTGMVDDITDQPFRRNLPLGTLESVLGKEAQLLSGDPKATVTLNSFETSDLPDLPRQIMRHTPELRTKMPHAGHLTLVTPYASVARVIGIGMGDNALIAEKDMPLLQRNEAFRTAWLLDGTDDLEARTALEQAIRDWSPYKVPAEAEEPVVIQEAVEPEHELHRAREHTKMIPGSGHGKVGTIKLKDMLDYDEDEEESRTTL